MICFDSDKSVIRFIDGKDIKTVKGMICIIPPKTPFSINKDPSDTSSICLKCLGTLAESIIGACGLTSPKLSIHSDSLDAYKKMYEYVNADIKSIENLNRCAAAFYQLLIEAIFTVEHIVERKPVIIAQKLKGYIDDNIQEDISVTSIARAFYLSETHVIRVFREQYTETPKQYILRKKIEASKKMLLETSLQIKEIAMILHFADSYHFSHTFKRFTGYSPEKFRMKDAANLIHQ